jgi:hypothetical protein
MNNCNLKEKLRLGYFSLRGGGGRYDIGNAGDQLTSVKQCVGEHYAGELSVYFSRNWI